MAVYTFRGGTHPLKSIHHGKKLSDSAPIRRIDPPKSVWISMNRATGAPLTPEVSVGMHVDVGDRIGSSASFVSAPVHSSVSGTVSRIADYPHASGGRCVAVEIQNDFKYTRAKSVEAKDPAKLTPQELLQLVREGGIVGMGGATFPTHVKLSPPKDKKIDLLIANGAECEPYLTADHRLMLEQSADIVSGILITLKILGIEHCVIGIEDNKPDALNCMIEACRDYDNIDVAKLRVKYPQGSEKQLIYAIAGRIVPSGGLPMDAGVVVSNVGTLKAISDVVTKGLPIVERVVTVSGEGIRRPSNLLVPIGTSFEDCINACGGMREDSMKVISGGPMMGAAIADIHASVHAGTSGILVLRAEQAEVPPSTQCIHCARCIDVCPMNLMPNAISDAVDRKQIDTAAKFRAMDCIECGTCVYVCPAKRHLLQNIRLAKNEIRAQSKKK